MTTAAASSSNEKGSRVPLVLLIILMVALIGVVWFHWDYKLIASPKGAAPSVPERQQIVPQTPAPVTAPAVVQQPVPTQPAPAVQQIAEETPVFVDIVIVDRNGGFPQFPVFEKVLRSSIKHNGKMTGFTCDNGKHTDTLGRVLQNAPYTLDETEQIGTISCPDKNNPNKMVVVRCNQSRRNVYLDSEGMYFKSASGAIVPAPEQATWFMRPISPN
jgi:hypothetical protein